MENIFICSANITCTSLNFREMILLSCFLAFPGNYNNPADMPVANPKEQTMMWQQNNYMSGGRDSGIQSGVNTQVKRIYAIPNIFIIFI